MGKWLGVMMKNASISGFTWNVAAQIAKSDEGAGLCEHNEVSRLPQHGWISQEYCI